MRHYHISLRSVSPSHCQLETYDLFSRDLPQNNLGMINDKSTRLNIEVAGDVYEIRQSPGLLTSSNSEGTTGAALWKISPLIAEWLADTDNFLWSSGILHAQATIVELGCGITGLIGCVIGKRVLSYLLTDQRSVLKLLRENVNANAPSLSKSKPKGRASKLQTSVQNSTSNIHVLELNWETDNVDQLHEVISPDQPIDVVIVCDCVFNDFLLEPLVNMCEKICLRSTERQTLLLIAQQLRSDQVFSAFLEILLRRFRVWRFSNPCLSKALQDDSGFAVHAAILR